MTATHLGLSHALAVVVVAAVHDGTSKQFSVIDLDRCQDFPSKEAVILLVGLVDAVDPGDDTFLAGGAAKFRAPNRLGDLLDVHRCFPSSRSLVRAKLRTGCRR